MKEKPIIAVSRCLLGEKVRYDGDTKAMPQLISHLEAYFNIIGVCPEVEIGLSVPRPPVQLVNLNEGIQAIGLEDDKLNITSALTKYAKDFVAKHPEIVGYVLKARSPSCGVGTTPIYPSGDLVDGIFAYAVRQQIINIPMVNEIHLASSMAFKQFVQSVMKYAEMNK